MRLRAPSARAALLLALASVASASGVSSDVAFARAAVARADEGAAASVRVHQRPLARAIVHEAV